MPRRRSSTSSAAAPACSAPTRPRGRLLARTRRAARPTGLGPALAQEALELARDAVAAGEVLRAHARLLLLGGLLEALDEGLHVGVALDGQRDLALVVGGGGLELARVDRDADQALELSHQRKRGLRV